MTRSAMPATTPRSWVIQMRPCRVAPGRLDLLDDLRLGGHVEGGGGLVGDEQVGLAGDPDGDHDALSHAAGELVG
jgi:hypothetical protein